MDCIFCKIVKGEIPSFKIYEDDNYLAFLDNYPNEYAHTLVIPKKHYEFVWDVEQIGEYFEICRKIAKHFQKVTRDKFVYSIIHGQSIAHAHVHLFPNERKIFGEKLAEFTKLLAYPKLTPEKASEILDKYSLKN